MVASSEIICYLPCSFQIRGTLNSKKSRSMCMNEESTIVRTSDQFNFFWHYFASILQRGQIIMSTSMPLLCGYWIVIHHMPQGNDNKVAWKGHHNYSLKPQISLTTNPFRSMTCIKKPCWKWIFWILYVL